MEAPLLVAALLLLSSTLVVSDFCVCRSEQPQAALQKTIDYACGAGADCNSIHEKGPCYNPNNVVAHCSWAANSYFQKKRAMGATCDFGGTALVVTTDPSKEVLQAAPTPQVQVLLEHQRLRPGLGLGLEAQQGEPRPPSRPVPALALAAWEEPARGRTLPLGSAAWVQQARATWTRRQRACIQGPERLPSLPCSSPSWHSHEVRSLAHIRPG